MRSAEDWAHAKRGEEKNANCRIFIQLISDWPALAANLAGPALLSTGRLPCPCRWCRFPGCADSRHAAARGTGNRASVGTSFSFTPSPSGGALVNPGTRTPASARSPMSTTSSLGRRPPKGHPALSPPSGPRRLCCGERRGRDGQVDAGDIRERRHPADRCAARAEPFRPKTPFRMPLTKNGSPMYCANCCVVRGSAAIPVVLHGQRNQRFHGERIANAIHLHVVAEV